MRVASFVFFGLLTLGCYALAQRVGIFWIPFALFSFCTLGSLSGVTQTRK